MGDEAEGRRGPRKGVNYDIASQLADPMRGLKDRRGGRQYQLPRVKTTSLSPGLRTVVSDFETACFVLGAREVDAEMEALERGERDPEADEKLALAKAQQDRMKQTLLRKLLRMQNGDELLDVEQLKKNFRRLARVVHNIQLILETDRASVVKTDAIAAILKSMPEAMADVERIIGKRRSW